MSLPQSHRHGKPARETLRWIAVGLPVAGLGLLIGLLQVLTLTLHPNWVIHLTVYLAAMGIITAGAFLFSRYIFLKVRRQEEEIGRRTRELATLNAVGALVNESLDLQEILGRALDMVLEVTGAESGETFLLQPETDELVLAAFRGLHPEAFQQITRFKLSEGFPGWIAQTGKPLMTRELSENDPRFIRVRVVDAGFQSYLGVPLWSKGKLVGVLGIAATDPDRLASADIELLAALGKQIGVAIENARLSERLTEMTVLEERQRIAREMHDGVAQELGYLYVKMGELEGKSSLSAIQEELRHLKEVAAAAYEEVRQAIFGLKTVAPQGQGFVPTLAEYIQKFSARTGIAVELKVAAERATRLAPGVEVQLTRIIQEALANVRKHAQAKHAWVIFDTEGGRARVTIQDDGWGFDPREATRLGGASFGLQVMRERGESVGGEFALEAGPGRGTKVIVRFPLEA